MWNTAYYLQFERMIASEGICSLFERTNNIVSD